jgi:GNAT superfamily N-acetyltransferase
MRSLRNIAIRRASRDDMHAISTIATSATRSLCAHDYTPKQIESLLRYSLSDNVQLIDDRTYFVIENAGQIVAAGGWSYRAALMANTTADDQTDPRAIVDPALAPARLRGFFVHPHFARRGLARTLVALCERAAANAGYSHLELIATATGRRLYRACGFTDIEWITQTYPTGVTIVIHRMSKAIHPALAPKPATKKATPATWFPVTIN